MTPLTALDTFRRITQYNSWHFWGMAGATGPVSVTKPSTAANACRPVLRQYGWQAGDAVSRTQIAQMLEKAEGLVRSQLGYPIAPQFLTADVQWPRYTDPRQMMTAPIGADGRWMSIELPDGHVRAVGVEAITLLATATFSGTFPGAGGNNTLVYLDEDGDGLVDLAEITITDSTTPLAEIQLYVPAADRFGRYQERAEQWRVAPSTATRSGGTVTITAPAWVFVRPILYQGALAGMLNGLEPTDATNYLQSVEVCRRYCDSSGTTAATAQAALIWESAPWPWCACPASGSDPAGTATAIARVGIRDANLGLVTPAQAVYDSASGTWAAADCMGWWGCRPPDRVEVRYLAGRSLDAGEVAPPWDSLIVGMAAAMLSRQLGGCKDVQSLIDHWQTDVTRAAGGTTFQAQPRANNPFGPRMGQIDAWSQVQRDRLIRGTAR
jgi:hypothetical protein